MPRLGWNFTFGKITPPDILFMGKPPRVSKHQHFIRKSGPSSPVRWASGFSSFRSSLCVCGIIPATGSFSGSKLMTSFWPTSGPSWAPLPSPVPLTHPTQRSASMTHRCFLCGTGNPHTWLFQPHLLSGLWRGDEFLLSWDRCLWKERALAVGPGSRSLVTGSVVSV